MAAQNDEIASDDGTYKATIDGVLWVVHDERRQHLPELSDHCVTCLRAENERLREMLGAIAVTAEKVDGDPPPAVAALVIQAIARGARAALSGS